MVVTKNGRESSFECGGSVARQPLITMDLAATGKVACLDIPATADRCEYGSGGISRTSQNFIFPDREFNLPAFDVVPFGMKVPLWQYCIAAAPVALIPSLALVYAAEALLVHSGVNIELIPGRTLSHPVLQATEAVFIAPFVETLILALGIRILTALTDRVLLIAIASSVVWGAAHTRFGPLQLLGTTWAFFVYSWAFMTWRHRSFRQAFIAASVPHAISNAAAFALYFAGF